MSMLSVLRLARVLRVAPPPAACATVSTTISIITTTLMTTIIINTVIFNCIIIDIIMTHQSRFVLPAAGRLVSEGRPRACVAPPRQASRGRVA